MPIVSIGSFLDDLGDAITDPSNIVRAISLMGWPSVLAQLLPGALAIAAQDTLVALPGLVKGDSFSDAFISEFTWRLQVATEVLGADFADKQINQQLKAATADKEWGEKLARDVKGIRLDQGISLEAALAQLKVTPELLCQRINANGGDCTRPDVQAMALNLFLQEHVFDLGPNGPFDVLTGQRRTPDEGVASQDVDFRHLANQYVARTAPQAVAVSSDFRQVVKPYLFAPGVVPNAARPPVAVAAPPVATVAQPQGSSPLLGLALAAAGVGGAWWYWRKRRRR